MTNNSETDPGVNAPGFFLAMFSLKIHVIAFLF